MKPIEKIQAFYDVFNDFYYDGECVPQYPNLSLCFCFLDDNEAAEIEGKTDFMVSKKEDTVKITIKVKKELTREGKELHFSCILLHEMVHAYMFSHCIFELNKDKTQAEHGPRFNEIAKAHGLKDGFIIPNDEVIYIMTKRQ